MALIYCFCHHTQCTTQFCPPRWELLVAHYPAGSSIRKAPINIPFWIKEEQHNRRDFPDGMTLSVFAYQPEGSRCVYTSTCSSKTSTLESILEKSNSEANKSNLFTVKFKDIQGIVGLCCSRVLLTASTYWQNTRALNSGQRRKFSLCIFKCIDAL